MKYVIKNCPAILPMTKLCDSENMEIPSDYCKDITDCLLKRIVEKCKMNMPDDGFKYVLEHKNDEGIIWLTDSAKAILNILQLLEIEEVDE